MYLHSHSIRPPLVHQRLGNLTCAFAGKANLSRRQYLFNFVPDLVIKTGTSWLCDLFYLHLFVVSQRRLQSQSHVACSILTDLPHCLIVSFHIPILKITVVQSSSLVLHCASVWIVFNVCELVVVVCSCGSV